MPGSTSVSVITLSAPLFYKHVDLGFHIKHKPQKGILYKIGFYNCCLSNVSNNPWATSV